MDRTLQNGLLQELAIPVIICRNTRAYPIVYMNQAAELYFSPHRSVNKLIGVAYELSLMDIMRFRTPEHAAALNEALTKTGRVEEFLSELVVFDGREVLFSICAKAEFQEDGRAIFVLAPQKFDREGLAGSRYFMEIVNTILYSEDMEASISIVISMAGQFIHASRVYVFEEISKTATRNTYEWCDAGVRPEIQNLQHLNKADYNYDAIVSSGMYITNDVSMLPENDREILAAQGIRAIAIIALYLGDRAIGYVGFDDCVSTRDWSHDEIHFLQSIGRILLTLIRRRNAEQEAKQNASLLQLVSDNSDDIIYVRDMEDYTVLLVNRALTESLGVPARDIIGKKCWEVLQNQKCPCDFCPALHMKLEDGQERSEIHQWERFNPHTKRIYKIKDSLIRWNGGRIVHVETASDISQQKEYEKKLERLASMDTMMGIHNREWGGSELQRRLEEDAGGHLCFIDVDGLKKTNDAHGHKTGDEMLLEIVRLIRGQITGSDLLCRWGGDEFLLWLDGTQERAEEIFHTITEEMRLENQKGGRDYVLSFSYGIIPFVGDNYDALVSHADQLMYQAKMKKRGLYRLRRKDDPIDERMM